MADPTNLSEIDLTPIPGKTYFNLEREWREEFIYFALIDRFHDDQVRTPVLQPNRSNGISTPNDCFGGKIKGITTISITSPAWVVPPSGCRLSSGTTPTPITATTLIIT